jgi:polyketide synthase 12/epothilone polyketide synthase D
MSLSRFYCDGEGQAPPVRPAIMRKVQPIAVVGIGCRFPGAANDPQTFWRLLETGADAIRVVPNDRWNLRSFYDPDRSKPGKTYSRWGGFVEGIDRFDPQAFGISPREAARMDPQHRLLLETAWEGLEDAGLPLDKLAGTKTSVFVGISSFDYSVLATSFRDRGEVDVYSNTGGSLSIAANRISYLFDFRGPSASVDTACSSALVAVHLACESIWRDGCSLALAGGVNALLLPDWYVGFCRMGMLAPDGRCRAFDARGSGFVRSEGAGMVVLKPLGKAREDGDRVYAVIRGTAVNQDGRTPGMTVPSQEAQAALLRDAYENAGVAPANIQYIEAHGTGTPVGDPIEARALGRVLSAGRTDAEPCLIGSVKTNIGHLEAGAGIAGLIKVSLALHHRRIPGNLHFEEPNPEIDFKALKLRVPTHCEDWPAHDGPALAGVNAFGFGGTNAHVVLEEAPPDAQQRNAQQVGHAHSRAWLVPLSARGPEALRAAANAWRECVGDLADDTSLDNLAATAACRRTHHEYRLALVARSKQELAERLEEFAAGRRAPGFCEGRSAEGRPPRVAFVCAGQGPQWWAMGRQLLHDEPIFRAAIERCDAIVRRLGDWSLLRELTADETETRMSATAIAQPCLFAIQVALSDLWAAWGIRPEAVVGHSVGEVAAAYLAGVFDLEDAVRIVYERGRCMERAPRGGRMLAAAVGTDEARRLIAPHDGRVTIAAVNSPNSVTLSGEPAPLAKSAETLEARGVFCRQLKVEYAFHSADLDAIRGELLTALEGIRPRAPSVPLFSTVNGRRIEGRELGPEYWWKNVRRMVRFAEGVQHLSELGCDTIVELGPHPVLSAAVTECYQHEKKSVRVLPSLRRNADERVTMLRSLAELHVAGYPVDWKGLLPGPHRFVDLPRYAWQRSRFWHESEESALSRLTPPAHPLLGIAQGGPSPSWEARLDLRLAPYLADHRVQQAAILPAAAYFELAFAVGREAFGNVGCELTDATLSNPCFLAAESTLVLRTSFDRDSSTVQVHTRPVRGRGEWTLHFTAVLRSRSAGRDECVFSAEDVRERRADELSDDACYDQMRRIGLDYGPAFRGIKRVWQGDSEAIGLVELPKLGACDQDDYLFHPALLDSCLQVTIPAGGKDAKHGAGLYLPHRVDEVRLLRKPGHRLWVHARLLEATSRYSTADIDIYDEDGHLAVRLRGLRSQRVAGGRDTLNDLLYAYQWVSQQRSEAGAGADPGRWLVFADRGRTGAELAQRLEAQGHSCVLVFDGPAFGECGNGRYQLNAARSEDMLRLIETLAGPGQPPCRGIVHLWNLDAPAPENLKSSALTAVQDAGLLSVVHLIQAWDQRAGDQAARLFLVTRGAQSVGDEPKPVAMAQSPVIGLGRVVAGEYPRLRARLVDLDPEACDGGIRMLLDELQNGDDEDEVAFRGSDRYVHCYMPAAEPTHKSAGTERPTDVPYRLACPRPGSLDGLVHQEMRRRAPGPGEVEIEVYAAGLNFSDVMKALGLYPGLADGQAPLGAECSGRIAAVGDDVHDFRAGDEVLAVGGFAFSSHVVTRAELVAPKPPRLSFEEAATLPIAFLTASYALEHLARIVPGEKVLIHSGSGGVGLAAVQLARRGGAEVFATAGAPEKRKFLESLGIPLVMDSRTIDFADQVRARTGGSGVDVILNSLPGEAIPAGIRALADYGRFLEIGKRDIYQNTRLGLQPFRKNLSFFAIDLDRVMRERPAFLGRLLRTIVQRVREGELDPLPCHAWPMREAVEAFRFMQRGKHIGKLALSLRNQPVAPLPAEDEPVSFHADATYLITGGLGGFGLAVARWMVERGARHIALAGRRGAATPEAQGAVAELEEAGAHVLVCAADVSNEHDVAALLAQIERTLPPLRGVVHAAMVLEDALLLNLDRERMERVLAAKVSGAWNLHLETARLSLDFFIMFSSLSSVFGHAGQANYAAANAFLDALAWHRRAQGLPALAINWGYLAEVGYLARRSELRARLERQGVLSFSVQEALALLEKAMLRQAVQVSVMRVEWSRWRGLGATSAISPRFAHLCRRTESLDGQPQRSLGGRSALASADPQDRPQVMGALLRDKLARVLGTSPEGIDGEKPLLQLGLDSLMAVELRNWIESELEINLPIVDLMRSPSLSDLTDVLLEHFGSGLPKEGANGHIGVAAEAPQARALGRIDRLSAEEVDAMLTALLGEKGHSVTGDAGEGEGLPLPNSNGQMHRDSRLRHTRPSKP